MKVVGVIITVLFATQAQAALEFARSNYPLVKCLGEKGLTVNVFNVESSKTAQMVVQDTQTASAVVVANERVQTVEGTDSQLFISPTTSLRIVQNGEGLKGFLNLHRDQPGVGVPVNCETYFHILSPENVSVE